MKKNKSTYRPLTITKALPNALTVRKRTNTKKKNKPQKGGFLPLLGMVLSELL
jgi:hypothetical protein